MNDYENPTQKKERKINVNTCGKEISEGRLLFCWLVIIVYFKDLFWSKFSHFDILRVRTVSNS